MIRHVVLFRWREETPPAALAEVDAALGRLAGRIPSIRRYEFGADLGIGPGGFDFALVADFDDEEGYRRYAEDPIHREVVERLIRPITAQSVRVQYRLRAGGPSEAVVESP